MRVFVAGVSSESQYVKSIMSFYAMKLRDGDIRTIDFGKPGIHARRNVGSLFEQDTKYDALLLVDLDMIFPEDMLEKMRTHDLDIVSGHYFRRRTDPMMSVMHVDRGQWPYIPMLDPPTEGLHEVASCGFGAILIKREVYMAVKEFLAPGGHPFDEGPLEWVTGDKGNFGADMRFSAVARKLGYIVWMDASIECPHGHTVWLTKKLYDQLGHRDKHAQNWATIFQTSKELHGMNRQTAQIRIEQLEMARKEIHEELLKAQEQANFLKTRLVVVDGQIAEREVDLQENTSEQVALPILGSEEAVDAAIRNRSKSVLGHETEEDVHNDDLWREKRRVEAEGVVDTLFKVREDLHGEDAV